MERCTEQYEVIGENGLAASECVRFMRAVGVFDAKVRVRRLGNDQWVSGQELLELMVLSATKGSVIEIQVESNAPAAVFSAIASMDDLLTMASEKAKQDALVRLEVEVNEKAQFRNQLVLIEGYDISKGILIDASQQPGKRASLLRQAIGGSLILTVVDPNDVYTDAHVIRLVERRPGFIMLPLSLPNFCSLRIAETIHQMQLGIRVLLVSDTECPGEYLHYLFDSFTSSLALNQGWIRSSLGKSVVRLTRQDYLQTMIKKVLDSAVCFRTYGGRHLMDQRPHWDQYEGSAESGTHATVDLYKRVRYELQSVSEDLSELPDLSGTENELIQSISTMDGAIQRGASGYAGAPAHLAFLSKAAIQQKRKGRITRQLPALTAFTKMPPLFISYSHEDSKFVDQLEESLISHGHIVWRDVKNSVSGPLEQQIKDVIQQSIVLIVLTRASVNSDWVEWEARRAREAQKAQGRYTLCPVSLDDAWHSSKWPQRLREQIQEFMILDFSEWEDTSSYDKTLPRLLEGLDRWYQEAGF